MENSLRTCPNGHQFYKNSDCPTCPSCELERQQAADFMSRLSGPARRALESHNIATASDLSQYSEAEILKFHGVGPASLPVLRKVLAEAGLSFK